MPSKTISVLGAARLSKDADESTSIELQSSGIYGWAKLCSNTTGDNYQVVHVSEDSDVSGAVCPFDRAGLGPYLREPLLGTWTVLVVFRLDRLTRSIADFEDIWKFLEGNGKTLASVAEQIDFGTTAGRLMARQLVIFAEYEREMIRARVKNAYDAVRASGKYPGLQFPFGYVPVKLPGKGWGLEPHPIYGAIVEQAADRLVAGESLSAICRWLDAERIPTPRNAVREHRGKKPVQENVRWNQTSLAAMFRSPAVIGEATVSNGSVHRPQPFRDDSGVTVKRADPLISRQKWEQVKEILAQNAARQGPMVYRAPLLRVAYCARCNGGILNTTTATYNGKQYRYYRCSNERLKRGCDARRIKSEDLESAVEIFMLETYGSRQIIKVVEIAGIDYSTQMYELAEAIGDLSTKIALGRVGGQDVSQPEEQRRIHEANLATLAEEQKRSGRQPRFERPIGTTFAECWRSLDWNGRNDVMRRNNIKVLTQKCPDGSVSLIGLPDLETFTGNELDEPLHMA